MKASDWLFVSLLFGGPGAVAITSGAYVYSYQTCFLDPCDRPYGNVGLWLISLGTSGVLFALLCLDSARARIEKPARLVTTKPRARRSNFFKVLIILLGVNIGLIAVLSAGLLAPHPYQCQGLCPTEQLTITQVSFGPSASQVTFHLANSGTVDYTITQALAQGAGISGQASVSVTTGNVVHWGGTLSLTVTFTGVTFQSGARYDFIVVSSQDNKFPYAAIAP